MKLMKADLHIHSRYSRDALSSLKAILKRAKKKKLDLIAITDHDSLKGAKEAKKMAPQFGLEVIIGEEIETKDGDIIALFIEDLILSRRPLLDTIKEIHRQGGLAIVPHPDNWLVGGLPAKVLLKVFDQLDGIELFNGSWVGGINRKKNEKLNQAIFHLAQVGGSDAHLAKQVGCAYTVFPGENPLDLYTAIKNRLTGVAGRRWSYLDFLYWLILSPIIFCRSPETLKAGIKLTIKRGLIAPFKSFFE